MNTTNNTPHWSKNPIVWLILFFPTLAVVAGFYTFYLAVESDDGLVSDDYYKEGIGINKTISADINAVDKNISGLISINFATGSIQVNFSKDIKTTLNKELSFKLVHRTIPGFDQETTLNQVDDTMLYTGTVKALPGNGGRWRWEINQGDWRISKRFLTQQQEVIVHSFPHSKN